MPPPSLETSGSPNSLIAQSPSLLPQLRRAQAQELLTYLFIGVIVLLLIAGSIVTYQYALPQPHWIKLGHIARFSTAQPVRIAVDRANVWVVHTPNGFIVLDAIPNDRMKCLVDWEIPRQKFADPCLGTQYTLAGVYALEGPPPARSLNRYPTRIDANHNLFIEFTSPIPGLTYDELKVACFPLRRWSTLQLENYWPQGCDIEEIGYQ